MNESIIFKKLNEYFTPTFLEIKNESEKHANHEGSPNTGDSHFYVIIKCERLKNLSRLEGQREIFKVLEREMNHGIHALRIKIMY